MKPRMYVSDASELEHHSEVLTVEPLAHVDVSDLIAWVMSIPFEDWPQQHRLNDEIRPAMVQDLDWQGFGAKTDLLMLSLLAETGPGEAYGRMLSVVMPGHAIDSHRDWQPPDWIVRVHVPIVTNDQARMHVDGVAHHLEVGTAYLVNTTLEHSIRNDGDTPRIHLMFDVRRK